MRGGGGCVEYLLQDRVMKLPRNRSMRTIANCLEKPDSGPEQRLVFHIIALAALDALKGCEEAWEWVRSDDAKLWAKLVGFEKWPPEWMDEVEWVGKK